jgi:hypothetical protein
MKTLVCLLMGTGLLFAQFEYGEIHGRFESAFDKKDDAEARELVYKRLASSASFLRDITYTAWIESAKAPTKVDPLNQMENPKNPKYNPATGSAPAP